MFLIFLLTCQRKIAILNFQALEIHPVSNQSQVKIVTHATYWETVGWPWCWVVVWAGRWEHCSESECWSTEAEGSVAEEASWTSEDGPGWDGSRAHQAGSWTVCCHEAAVHSAVWLAAVPLSGAVPVLATAAELLTSPVHKGEWATFNQVLSLNWASQKSQSKILQRFIVLN